MSAAIREAWESALREQRKQLGKKYEHLVAAIEFDEFEATMESTRARYDNAITARCIDRLGPVFQQLDAFNRGITSIAAASEGSTIVWGVLLVLVKGACDYLQLLEDFSKIVEDLTKTVARINRYLKLLPTNLELQALSVRIINDYVQCCISALKFYQSKAASNLAKIFWWPVRKTFKATQDRIALQINVFEKEMRVDIDEILVNHARGQQPKTAVAASLFSVPYSRNEFFCGRGNTLEEINTLLSQRPEFEQPSCLLHSMGGMGKTQVALAYAYQARKTFPYVLWLPSQKETELASKFAELATKLGFVDVDGLGQSQKANTVRQWLETTDSPWLLIFDNVESMETIRQFWPSTSRGGAILVTSQIAALTQAIKTHIPLQPLDESEGAALLLDTLHLPSPSKDDRKAAKTIVNLIGGLPIAISHIAGSMFTSQLTLREAVKMFENQKYSYLWSGEHAASTHVYDQRLEMVWDIALSELSVAEKHLLDILSFLSPDAVHEDMILVGEELGTFGSDFHETFPRVRFDLARRQLIQRNISETTPSSHYLSLHRSLQLNLRARLFKNRGSYAAIFNEAVSLVRRVFPAQHKAMSVENNQWASYALYSPHVQALQIVAQASHEFIAKSSVFAQLLSDSANYYWEKGFLKLGVETCQLAVSIFESLEDPDPIAYSQPLTLWGLMAGEMGIRYRGEETFGPLTKCLEIRAAYLEQAPGGGDKDEQLLYGNAWGDICCACIDAGYYDEVEKYANINLALKSKVASEKTNPMFFGSSYMHLAHAYIGQKRFIEAKAFVSRCRKMAAIDYEPHTAAYQKFVYFEACVLKETGNLQEALTLHYQALDERLDLFGPFENNTRYSYYALGEIHHMLGDLGKAEEMLRSSLKALDRSSWVDEGAVARSRFHLAKVLEERIPSHPSRLTESRELQEQAATCRKQLMPDPEHIFEELVADPASYYDLMVPFTGRTRFCHDRVKPRKPEDQVKIPDRVADLQYHPAYMHWDPDDRNALLQSLS